MCFSLKLLYSSVLLIFIFSSSLLKASHIYLFSIIHLAFLLLVLWTLYLVNCLCSLIFFQGLFSCSFSGNKSLCLLTLLNFLIFGKLGAVAVYCALAGVSLCGPILIQFVNAQRLWWKSWIWHKYNFFPKGVLITVTLVASGDGAGMAGPEPDVNRCFFCSVAVTALFRTGASTKLLEQKPWGPGPSWLSPLPALAISPEGGSAGATLVVWCSAWIMEQAVEVGSWRETGLLLIYCLC